MKRLLSVTAVASLTTLLASGTARADGEPVTLVIPDAAVDVVPADMCPVSQSGQSNSGLGCIGVEEAGAIDPSASAMAITDALRTALEPFGVNVTNTRPPDYVPYMMLFASDEASEDAFSDTCGSRGVNCAALKRNGVAFTNGGSMNCMDPDAVAVALHTFGRMAGLEGTTNADDPMLYPLDFDMVATEFQNACAPVSLDLDIDDEGMLTGDMDLMQCSNSQHEECDDGEVNSHADLLARFGATLDDSAPPEIAITEPEDGAVVPMGPIVFNATVTDDMGFAGGKWTIASPILVDAGIESGEITQCTNRACASPGTTQAAEWSEGILPKPTDSDWSLELNGIPAGEYTVTFEASDLFGNVAEPITITVTIEGDAADDGGVDETGGGDDNVDDGGDDGNPFDTGGDDEGDETGGGDGGGDGGDGGGGGCAVGSAPEGGAMLLLLAGLFGLGLRNRND